MHQLPHTGLHLHRCQLLSTLVVLLVLQPPQHLAANLPNQQAQRGGRSRMVRHNDLMCPSLHRCRSHRWPSAVATFLLAMGTLSCPSLPVFAPMRVGGDGARAQQA